MNEVKLSGRLVKDPEIRYTPSGKVVCQFSLAVERFLADKNGNKEADFIPIVMWGKLAELAGNSLSRGKKVLISGHLRVRTYQVNSVRRWITEVQANAMEYMSNAPQQKDEFVSFGDEVQQA